MGRSPWEHTIPPPLFNNSKSHLLPFIPVINCKGLPSSSFFSQPYSFVKALLVANVFIAGVDSIASNSPSFISVLQHFLSQQISNGGRVATGI